MSDEPLELSIGSIRSEFLRVRVLRRTYPTADDYWDGNWLNTEIEISAGEFGGGYAANLRVDEFVDFRRQLALLSENLKGKASFTATEPWIQISAEGDGLGHFDVACEAKDNLGPGNTLNFRLGFDQTELARMLHQLGRIVERFPLRGSP
jgi:hypothetical protein